MKSQGFIYLVCLTWPSFELSGGMPEGGEYTGPGIENGWFDPANAGLGTHTITYTYTDPNSCENFAEETIVVDPCTGIDEITNGLDIDVYPNPTTGNLTVKFAKNIGVVEIIVVNTLNEIVYSESIKTTSQKSLNIDIKNQARGIYFINIKTEETEERLKVILK